MRSRNRNSFYIEKWIIRYQVWRVVKRIKPYATMQEAMDKVERLKNMVGETGVYRAVKLTEELAESLAEGLIESPTRTRRDYRTGNYHGF